MSTVIPLDQLSKLIKVMVEYGELDTHNKRRNFYFVTGYVDSFPGLIGSLNLDSNTYEFCVSLIRLLSEYGVLPDRPQHALYPLLEYLYEQVSGQEREKVLVEQTMALVEKWGERTSNLSTELDQIYRLAFEHFTNEDWDKSLSFLKILETRKYNREGLPLSLGEMASHCVSEINKNHSQQTMIEEYENILKLSKKSQWLHRSQKLWYVFLQKYPEFIDHPNFKEFQYQIEKRPFLQTIQDAGVPPLDRAMAGRKLAKVGDPRMAVLKVDSMRFCWIPSNSFWMGVNNKGLEEKGNLGEFYDIPYTFWISEFPVTVSQYEEFLIETRYEDMTVNYGEPFNLSNHPIVGVNHFQASRFTNWLTHRWKNLNYLSEVSIVALPSEREWEKVARGGEEFPRSLCIVSPDKLDSAVFFTRKKINPLPHRFYPYGDQVDNNKMNFDETNIGTTSPAGCFRGSLSPYGCEDMSGNVWEWTRDRNNKSIGSEEVKVMLRGGSFSNNRHKIGCDARLALNPEHSDRNIGFRIVVIPRESF